MADIFKWDSGKEPTWVYLATPLTSTDWDGDSYSTTARTVIDLSAVFGVLAGIKAVLIRVQAADSGSGAANLYFGVGPTSGATSLAVVARVNNVTNDYRREETGTCPCDSNGDIWYELSASGAGTMDVWIEIWGYYI